MIEQTEQHLGTRTSLRSARFMLRLVDRHVADQRTETLGASLISLVTVEELRDMQPRAVYDNGAEER